MKNGPEGPSFIPPHPALEAAMKKSFQKALKAAGPMLSPLLRIKRRNLPGLNDGLIYPGSSYPIDTPVSVVRNEAGSKEPLRGTLKVLVVLAEFPDRKFDKANTAEHFRDLFFSKGVLPHGSVREYFQDASNGSVDIAGEVVGPYRMPKKLWAYAHDEYGTGDGEPNARTMARDAAAAADPDVNFSAYDINGDGYVDAFIVIHAGRGAEETGSTADIWSHKWVLPGGPYNADKAKVYAYLTVPEDSRIGVCCHELGHLLFGFPDLYDTDYSSEGVGNWCLMGGGSWLGNGETPAHPSAWCKAGQKWVTISSKTDKGRLSIEDVKKSRTVHRFWKSGSEGREYFLVENRQRTGFDAELPGEGLLIWHIDDAIDANTDEWHPKVSLEQADGKQDLEKGNNRGDEGDAYPGSSGNRQFTPTSTPGSKAYGGALTGVCITKISDPDESMSVEIS